LADTKLTKLEFQIMEALWASAELSVREILDTFSGKRKPAYTTVQTTVYRLEQKGALKRSRKFGNLHLFTASISREDAQRSLVNDLLSFFDGKGQSVMAHLINEGKLSIEDIQAAERVLQQKRKGK
jgi:BlaI family transcriptional regulator, penicillinase repressor